jgi:hypothetical protein
VAVAQRRDGYGGRAPDGFAALGYDAAGVLLAAIEAAGSAEPARVSASLAHLEDYRDDQLRGWPPDPQEVGHDPRGA